MKPSEHKYKTFAKAYEVINHDHEAFKRYFNDKRLTQFEKKLLKALLLFKKSKNTEALQLLNSIDSNHPALIGFQCFMFGMIYNSMSEFTLASKYLVKSLTKLKAYEMDTIAIKSIHVLARVYFNLNDLERLQKYYKVFQTEFCKDTKHEVLDYEYRIYIAFLQKKSKKCFKLIEELCDNYKNETQSNMAMYEVLKFKLYLQAKDYDHCYKSYHKYCKLNGYKLKSTQKYMITLLNHLCKGTKAYVYKSDFKDNQVLFYELKVIRSLELKNHQEALIYWDKLQLLSPALYQRDFSYKGGKDLFFFALRKNLSESTFHTRKSKNQLDLNKLTKAKSALEKLELILNSSSDYKLKDDLILYIWNEQWTPKNDARLRTLIYRLKKKSGIEIDIKDGKYKKAS